MKIFALSILSLACRAAAFSIGGSILVAASIFAQEEPVDKIAQGELPSLLAIYKDIHSHPELSTREEKTSALVAKELRAVGCEVIFSTPTTIAPAESGASIPSMILPMGSLTRLSGSRIRCARSSSRTTVRSTPGS